MSDSGLDAPLLPRGAGSPLAGGTMEGAGGNPALTGGGSGKDRGDNGVGAAKQCRTVALDSTS